MSLGSLDGLQRVRHVPGKEIGVAIVVGHGLSSVEMDGLISIGETASWRKQLPNTLLNSTVLLL